MTYLECQANQRLGILLLAILWLKHRRLILLVRTVQNILVELHGGDVCVQCRHPAADELLDLLKFCRRYGHGFLE